MPTKILILRTAVVIAVAASSAVLVLAGPLGQRLVTVADTVRMTEYSPGTDLQNGIAQFSPNGSKFVIVVKKGDLEKNANIYLLLLFRTEDALRSSTPTLLVSLSSSSNRPGIDLVKWLDNETIAFLGEKPGELHQLFTINCKTHQLKRLTNHSTNLGAYTADVNGRVIFFTAEDEVQKVVKGSQKRYGLNVTKEVLSDLISGENRWAAGRQQELFLRRPGSARVDLIRTKGTIVNPALWLSPNGRYLVVRTMPMETPRSWKEYQDVQLQLGMRLNYVRGSPSYIYQYEIVDVRSEESRILVDAPLSSHSEVAWSSDSSSVVISDTFLPLDVQDAKESKKLLSSKYIAEVNIQSGEIAPITAQEMRLLRWNPVTNHLVLVPTADHPSSRLDGSPVAFQKTLAGWKSVALETSDLAQNGEIKVNSEEDMNSPPKIFVSDVKTGAKSLLLDLNPQFEQLAFGHVEDVMFKTTDGHEVNAGLYLPPTYEHGKRYPLVIQTHGWNPKRFWINGPYSTAFAAQPFVAQGIVVIQLPEDLTKLSTPVEAPAEMAVYEGAIDYLDLRGLIDRNRVGIIGFSTTGMKVEYTLTHSKYQFAAATLADIRDAGYFRYVSLLNFPVFASDSEALNGGAPFGAELASWMKSSPGFNLERVKTPVWMEANSPMSLFFEWEWFTGLTRLGKPVQLLYMPNAAHVLVKPWDRVSSQQGNVDWFCFWLKGEEDSDPAKADQYSRWRELRKLQQENDARDKATKEKAAATVN